MSEIRLPNFKSDDEEADFWDRFDTAQILEEGEEIELVYKPETAIEDKERYFVIIPDEIAQSLDVHEKERTRIFILLCMGKRIILEIG